MQKTVQAVGDLSDTIKDIETFKRPMKHYGILDSGPGDMYDMKEPSFEEVVQVRKHLNKRFLRNPDVNFLVFYIFACHGIQKDGKQSVVVNEFDTKTKFLKLINIESYIREWASKYHNTYHVALFACCREIYDEQRHQGCVEGRKLEAE